MYEMKSVFNLIKNSWPFLLGLIMGLYFITFNIIGHKFQFFPGDLGDARLNIYFLEHAHKFFTGQVSSFWSAPFMFPEPNVISYSDNLLGSAPFYSIFRLIGCDRETAFQCWFITMTILSYSCCFFFLNWVFKNKYAAVLGAMIFAFSMALQSQMTHAQTFPRFPIPLAFWMALLFAKEFKPIYLFLTLLAVVYQFYCGIYLGLMLSISIAVFVFVAIIVHWLEFKKNLSIKKWWLFLISSITINILILLPLMLPYYERSKQVGLNSYNYVEPSIPTVKSFLFSQKGSLFWDCLSGIASNYQENWNHQIFIGGVAIICFFIFCFFVLKIIIKIKNFNNQYFESKILILFFTAIITFLLFIRFDKISFYRIIFLLPGYGSMRSIARIVNIELLFFAFAAAFVFSKIFIKRNLNLIFLFVLFIGIITADNFFKEEFTYKAKKNVAQLRVNSLVLKMKKIPKNSIVSYEPNTDEFHVYCQVDAMLAAQSLNLKTINAYTATSAPGYDEFWNKMDSVSREHWLISRNVNPSHVFIVH